MDAGFERDESAYLFATIFNTHIYSRLELQKLFEEDQIVFSDLKPSYRHNLRLVKQGRGRQMDEPTKPDARLEAIETTAETLRLRLSELASELKHTKRILLIAAIALAILIFFRH
jgi:hypothetical protein